MEIKVFGPGCAKCEETERVVNAVVAEKGANITVTKVSDLKEMMLADIVSTPAVSVDGVVKITGRVPTSEEIAGLIEGAETPITADSQSQGAAEGASKKCCCGGQC